MEVVKCRLPKPPLPPRARSARCADRRQVGEERLAVFGEDLRADRHLQDHVGAARAGAVAAHPVRAGAGLEMLLVTVVDERVEAVHGLGPDIAAAAAVAPVGSAELDELLAPERNRTGPAVAGADEDLGLIEEFHRAFIRGAAGSGNAPRAPCRPAPGLGGGTNRLPARL